MLSTRNVAPSICEQAVAPVHHSPLPRRTWACWLATACQVAFLVAALAVMAVATSVAAGVGPGFLSFG